MSTCYRPVVETWGEPTAFEIEGREICEILEEVARAANLNCTETLYGDVLVFWCEDGARFIQSLQDTSLELDLDYLKEQLDGSDAEEELKRLRAAAASWASSLNSDGSLRLYID